jgi:hypothetical protein
VPLWQSGEDQGAFIRSVHAKQTQPHRATGKANNEQCRVERSCRGQAGAPARRQGEHDPSALVGNRRLRLPKPRLALTIPARPSSGCGRDERGGERGRRLNPDIFPSIAYRFKFAVLVRGDVDGGQGQTAPAAVVESLRANHAGSSDRGAHASLDGIVRPAGTGAHGVRQFLT